MISAPRPWSQSVTKTVARLVKIFSAPRKRMEKNIHENSQQEQLPVAPLCRQADRLKVRCPACGRQMSAKHLRYVHVCAIPREPKTPEEYMADAQDSFTRRGVTLRAMQARKVQASKWSSLVMF